MNNVIALTKKKQAACVGSQGAFMIGTHQTQRLTSAYLVFILCPLSQKTKDGPSTPNNQGRNRPLSTVVFLCPPKTQAALCCLHSMAGCIGRPLKRSAGSLAGVENPIQSATQYLSILCGGYSLYQGVTA